MKKWGRIRFLVFAAHKFKSPRAQMISHLKIIKTTKQQSFFFGYNKNLRKLYNTNCLDLGNWGKY